ncbi:MAG: insulinase family protein [Paludibacteraceae bacterium]|nr:insulinase family protein [Paludibacteraceae bacterium]
MLKRIVGILLACVPYTPLVSAPTLVQDTSFVVGKLSNGMTYYIRHNHQTPNVAEYYIAQNVGSILEEPQQRGLAHFLEHMAFNGTQNFPGAEKGGLREWCEKVGIKFGTNLNAYTSVDETVYNISSAPVNKAGVEDTCLLILHDWSHYLLLKDDEIDKERGVVTEEWRTRRASKAVQRLWEDAMPVIYKGSKYEDCLPIGSMDVVANFAYNDLRNYYNKWYRPDLQAIIVVGDINVQATEAKIKRIFGSIPAQEQPADRIYYPVPDNEDLIIFAKQDKEQPITLFNLYMKRDAASRQDKQLKSEYIDGIKIDIVRRALTERLQKMSKQKHPPFMSSTFHDGTFFVSGTKDAVSLSVSCLAGKISTGIESAVTELERLRQHGITKGEMNRAKAEILRIAELGYAERDKRRNGHYVHTCLKHFTKGEPMLAADYKLSLVKEAVETIGLDQVNSIIKEVITNKNQVVTLFGPVNATDWPSEQSVKQTISRSQSKTLSAYQEEETPTQLIAKQPKPGKIKNESESSHGYREFLLGNGMRVYAKSTDIEEDNIQMKIFSLGGQSVYADEDIPNLRYTISTIKNSGVANFSDEQLDKMLAGKTVRVSPYIQGETEGMQGSSSVKDLETMFQLVYLYFTQPRKDNEAFLNLMNKQRSFLANRDANPNVTLGDSVNAIVYNHHPRKAPVTVETLDKVSFERIYKIYKERFANAADFSVILTGKIDYAVLRPLLCRYLASLPAKGSLEKVTDRKIDIQRGEKTCEFYRMQTTPSAVNRIYITADVDYNALNDLKLSVLCQLMRMVYTEKVREEKGGTYGVSVSGELSRTPKPEAVISISFSTAPQKNGELLPIIFQQLDSMALYGPKEKDLDKVKEYEKKTYGQLLVNNDYWEYVKYNELVNFVDFDKDYLQLVDSLTCEEIRKFAQLVLSQNNRLRITMLPEKAP